MVRKLNEEFSPFNERDYILGCIKKLQKYYVPSLEQMEEEECTYFNGKLKEVSGNLAEALDILHDICD